MGGWGGHGATSGADTRFERVYVCLCVCIEGEGGSGGCGFEVFLSVRTRWVC